MRSGTELSQLLTIFLLLILYFIKNIMHNSPFTIRFQLTYRSVHDTIMFKNCNKIIML